MKKYQKGNASILLIIIILLAIGGRFYFYNKQKTNMSAPEEVMVTSTTTSTSTNTNVQKTILSNSLPATTNISTQKPIYSKNGLSLNLPSGWTVKIDEGKYGKNCDYFTFTPPNYKYEFFGGFDLCFSKTASNINDWIVKNAPEYKDKVNVIKSDYLVGDKYTYSVSEIEDENTGLPFYVNVILGTRSSYTYHFSQDGSNGFTEIIRKNIFPYITIE